MAEGRVGGGGQERGMGRERGRETGTARGEGDRRRCAGKIEGSGGEGRDTRRIGREGNAQK